MVVEGVVVRIPLKFCSVLLCSDNYYNAAFVSVCNPLMMISSIQRDRPIKAVLELLN